METHTDLKQAVAALSAVYHQAQDERSARLAVVHGGWSWREHAVSLCYPAGASVDLLDCAGAWVRHQDLQTSTEQQGSSNVVQRDGT